MKQSFIFTFLFTGFFVGALITWQFKTGGKSTVTFFTDEMSARQDLLKDFLDDQSYLQSRIVFLRKQIEKAQAVIDNQAKKENIETLDGLKKEIGLLETGGKGIEVTLDDSPLALRGDTKSIDKNLVQASDIRDLVNILNSAGAESIAVNNQRVIAMSPISSVGLTILVNNSYVSPPFSITAIGDSAIMVNRIQNRGLLPDLYDRIQKNKLTFKIAIKDAIAMPIYNGDLKDNYLNLVK
ncbi:DUF881 domain-containing protein [Candidatus Peregrinibacteria bacterium]|nr:DUF881 domain-containing protein [Candidatus Peregrinibacteria bacterium]